MDTFSYCMQDSILKEDLDNIAEDTVIDLQKLQNRTVLVTGATGLIGSSIIKALLHLNHTKHSEIRIIALVRNIAKANAVFGAIAVLQQLRFIVGDVVDPISIDEPVDFVFHCASITASKAMIENPIETIFISVEGTKNLLEFAKTKAVTSFVYISSMEVYGSFSCNSGEITEQDLGFIDPLILRSNYPESKRLCENMCIAYLAEYGVPVKIARLAQTFGPGLSPSDNRVFAQFIKSVINGQDIVLHTQGLSEGNYCYIRDAIKGLFIILLNGQSGEAYNVSNPSTHTTIYNMAKLVAEQIANNTIKVIFDIPETNTYGYAAETKMKLNSDKLQKLGWTPEVGLEEAYSRLLKSMVSTLVSKPVEEKK